MATLSESVGAIIKRKRARDRFTQAELGSRIGVSGSYIGAVESGTTSLRLSELEGLASVFRTTALDIMSEAASTETKTYSDERREQESLLSVFAALPAERRRQVIEFCLFQQELQARPSAD